MARNPFRKPYVFSKKWAIWIGVGFPILLYINLTAPDAKKSDVVSTSITTLVLYIVLPWVTMRVFRSFRKKSPQGKTYDQVGEVIDGEVLNLKVGYRPRVRIQARLVNGVLELPAGKIAVTDIESIKAKDPRSSSIKLLVNAFSLGIQILYFYFLLQPMILLFFLVYIPYLEKQLGNPRPISVDQRFEDLKSIPFFSHIIHSQALLQPTLIALSIVVIMTIIKPFIYKTALVINTNEGSTLHMPYSLSLNPYIMNLVETPRLRRFIKKVKKAKKKASDKI